MWEEIKSEERNNKSKGSLLDNISKIQPALNQAYEIQLKAAEVGFDWDNIEDVVKKIDEEVLELKEVLDDKKVDKIEDELGDLLFAVVNLSRFKKINPEIALLRTRKKYKKRFKYIEEMVEKEDEDINEVSLKKLDSYWNQAKEKNNRRK